MKKVYKQKKIKGFTLVELLSVIAILVVVITISVPLYKKVKDVTLEKQYKNVITTIENAAEKYARETYITKISVEDLINEGYLSADDQNTIYNPINKSSLNCYIVVTKSENGVYISEFKENENLSDNDGKCKDYISSSDFQICVVGDELCNPKATSVWYNKDIVLEVNLPKDIDLKTVSYEWKSTVGDIGKDSTLSINAETIKKATYTVNVTYKKGNDIVTGSASKEISIDKQKPIVEINVEKENEWAQNKKLKLIGSDGIGSGIKGYMLLEKDNNSCPIDLNSYKENSDFTLNENKNFIFCVADKSGNITKIEKNITKIDKQNPKLFIYYDNDKYIRNTKISFDVQDEGGLNYYEIKNVVGENVFKKYYKGENNSIKEEFDLKTEGMYTIRLYDLAGLYVEADLIIDITKPILKTESSSINGNSIISVWNEKITNEYFYMSTSQNIPAKDSMKQVNSYTTSCWNNYGFVYATDLAGNESDVILVPNYHYVSCDSPSIVYPPYDGGGSVCDSECQMIENSKKWKDASDADKKKLHEENVKLSQDLISDGKTVNYDPSTGLWVVDGKIINCMQNSTGSGCK